GVRIQAIRRQMDKCFRRDAEPLQLARTFARSITDHIGEEIQYFATDHTPDDFTERAPFRRQKFIGWCRLLRRLRRHGCDPSAWVKAGETFARLPAGKL